MSMIIRDIFPRSRARRAIAYESLEVFKRLEEYLPLTVRQVYYQLVSVGVVDNRQSEYQKVSKVLTEMREEGIFPYSYITDRSRRTIDKRGISGIHEFVSDQIESLFDPRYYHRCRVQAQDVYIEVSTEKDALSAVIEEAVWPYCTRINVIRGQNSTTFVEQMATRFRRAEEKRQEPVLIHIGDFDPSGWAIPQSIEQRLSEVHAVDIRLVVAALTERQIEAYQLPISMDAAKQTDANYKSWIALFGDDARPVEVDALHPRDLRKIIVASIERELDMTDFLGQMEIETDERKRLTKMRRDTLYWLREQYPALVSASQT